jgi:hypothetical protein
MTGKGGGATARIEIIREARGFPRIAGNGVYTKRGEKNYV